VTRPVGPALSVADAAAYIGWGRPALLRRWRTRPLLAACAVRDGRRLTFLKPGLDRYLAASRVTAGAQS